MGFTTKGKGINSVLRWAEYSLRAARVNSKSGLATELPGFGKYRTIALLSDDLLQ
jgi:hypothetical protein